MTTRVVHFNVAKKDPKDYDLYIGRTRKNRPEKYGNLYSHKDDTLADFKVESREHAVWAYTDWLVNSEDPRAKRILENIEMGKLNNRRLVCWCKPALCHGDILADLVNGKVTVENLRELVERKREQYTS